MEQQVATLLSTLRRPAAPSETKLTLLNTLKSDIKHYRVPEAAQSTIFDCLKLAISQQTSTTLATSAFSTLGHLVKRLKIQDVGGSAIASLAPSLFPALQDRLGDARESNRAAATQALGELWPYCMQEIEGMIRDEVIPGSHVRAKEAGMQWVVKMHEEEQLPFKTFVSPMVACLEDADGNVREAAKNALVDLFRNASSGAKADLKKQLKMHDVRKSIEGQILSSIGALSSAPAPSTTTTTEQDMGASTRSLPAFDSQWQEVVESDAAKPPPVESIPIDPIYVQSQRELDDIFQDMRPHFEGKEAELNWNLRDNDVTKMKRLLRGNAPNEFHAAYMIGIKSLRDGILKVANSLRTTVSTNGCELVQELTKTLGPALDAMAEIFLQSFVKMCAATKHITAENANRTVDAIFQNVSYDVRLMQHIFHATQDKNVQPRQYAAGWLKTILRKQAGYRSHFESSGGLKLAEDCIAKGVVDANPKVRENMRAVFWIYATTWAERGEALLVKLEPKWRDAVRKDPNNPDSSMASSQSNFGASTSKAPAPPGRTALKDIVAAQKRAKAAGGLPDRPNSAMATLSPVKTKSISNLSGARAPSALNNVSRRDTRVASAASIASSATRSAEHSSSTNAAVKGGGSLMSGPVRRPRRPEVPRPKTADPYASSRLLRPETPADRSPANTPSKGTGASKSSIPTTSASRNRAKTALNPHISPVKNAPAPPLPTHVNDWRPSDKDSNDNNTADLSATGEDNFTIVLPFGKPAMERRQRPAYQGHARPGIEKTMSVDSGIPAMVADDGFTMVMPSHMLQREGSPLAHRSPMQSMQEDRVPAFQRPGSAQRSPERTRSETPQHDAGMGITRRGSPLKQATPQPAEVQVYEDPFTADAAAAPTADERKVLGELPVNENAPRVQSPTHSAGSSTSPAGSPHNTARFPNLTVQDRAEVLRNRRLLASAIDRIRDRRIDVHGFRRVQDIAKSQHDIWDGGKKYDELMAVLLEYLQTFDSDPRTNQPASKAVQKNQALGLVRALLTLHRKSALPWFPKALVTVLGSRSTVNSSSINTVADLDKTAEDIVRLALPVQCVDAVLDFMPAAPSPRSTTAGLAVLRSLLSSMHHRGIVLSPSQSDRLAQAAARYLDDVDAAVRKADVDFACELHDLVGPAKQDFWLQFRGVDEGRMSLLAYYIARRTRTTGGEVQ